MVRTNACAARCWRHRSRLQALLLALGMASSSHAARAAEVVVLQSGAGDLESLVGRLASELASNGYAVRIEVTDAAPPCEATAKDDDVAHVSLVADPAAPASVLATLCFRGATVVTSAPRADPARFAVTTAEALNGLRAGPAHVAPAAPLKAAPPAAEPVTPAAPVRASSSLSLAETLVIDPAGFPVLWGSSLDAAVPLGRRVELVFGGFFPISRAELSNSTAELRAGLAFVRVGAALRYSLGGLALNASLVAGPTLSWVTAQANAPYVGGSASTLGALSALGVQLGYPERGPLFALGQCRASLLLPAVRFALPNDAPRTQGPLLFEASLGVGARL
ncbi:MAG: hypothetical protein QM756_07225 [Polyangiaceae bacterium]